VLTFVDITEQKRAQEIADGLDFFMTDIVGAVRGPLLVLNSDLRVVTANPPFYGLFKTSAEETERRLIYELGDGQWDIPALRKMLDEVLSTDANFEGFRVEHDFPGIGRKQMLLNARRVRRADLKTDAILLAMEDVTGK
jgi:PAS domain-containing protein